MSTYPDIEAVRQAIREHRLVEFYYVGELITAEPYLLGKMKRYQHPMLIAWAAAYGWKEYSLMRIRRFRALEEQYATTREDYRTDYPELETLDTAASVLDA